jgi:hypothetical protein
LIVSKQQILQKRSMFAYDASLSDGVVCHARPRPERQNLWEPIPSANPKDPHARCPAVTVDKRMYPYPFTMQPGSGLKYFLDKPWRSDIGILLVTKYIVCRHLIPKFRQCQVDFRAYITGSSNRKPSDLDLVIEQRGMRVSAEATPVSIVGHFDAHYHLAMPTADQIASRKSARLATFRGDGDS